MPRESGGGTVALREKLLSALLLGHGSWLLRCHGIGERRRLG
jgi:hypothetical protein